MNNKQYRMSLVARRHNYFIIMVIAVLATACGAENIPQTDYSTYENDAWRLYRHNNDNSVLTNAILFNINRAIELGPDRVCVASYLLRAECWAAAGKVQKAVDDWSVAIDRDPTNRYVSKAFCGRAVFYGQQKKYSEALSDINQAVNLSSNYVLARAARATIYKDMGMYEEAKSEMDIAVRLNADITNYINYNEFCDEISAGTDSKE